MWIYRELLRIVLCYWHEIVSIKVEFERSAESAVCELGYIVIISLIRVSNALMVSVLTSADFVCSGFSRPLSIRTVKI